MFESCERKKVKVITQVTKKQMCKIQDGGEFSLDNKNSKIVGFLVMYLSLNVLIFTRCLYTLFVCSFIVFAVCGSIHKI